MYLRRGQWGPGWSYDHVCHGVVRWIQRTSLGATQWLASASITSSDQEAGLFRQGDEVWVKNKCKPGWHPGVVEMRTGKLSYKVLISGQIKRKHAYQLRSRSGAMDDKPKPTVVNQQQEVEVQESWLTEQQLREQDLRPRPEVENQSLRKRQCEEGPPVHPTQWFPTFP
ncbi:hypothetical protein J437_LFUL015258 [Ladona fulva]|uniref:Uncharacterized protein n=1 Tax=Ladona fulva TaxID=123851 RepID=A0A8K0KR13_LADFU|nr:hypothetical protein J437_LFUL015258 [Ladona fulva]